jgi:hypothetical protein
MADIGERGLGRALFAAVLLFVGGVLDIIYGIAAVSNSSFFAHDTTYIFSTLRGWGWITLGLGILSILASVSIMAGGTFGRWFGIVIGGLNAIGALLALPAYPFWSLAIFALSLWIIHGLVVFGQPAPAGRGGR